MKFHISAGAHARRHALMHTTVTAEQLGDINPAAAVALRYDGGFIQVPNKPGLGIDELNEKLIKKQACKDFPAPWTPTKEWDKEWANDRRWS